MIPVIVPFAGIVLVFLAFPWLGYCLETYLDWADRYIDRKKRERRRP